ncbi:MAG: ABC transporter ATP-binding protein [Verrucomicrobiales bacterium]|nr:ABC transporter ATP-binding protein [Verrucomicrobiales bacterium]
MASSSAASPATLVANGLVKQFGDFTAVNQVSLQVHPGEVVGLLGPNGAGKTTTLRMLAGILSPTSGTVTVLGTDLHAQPLLAKKRIGFLSGDTQLYRRLSPREMLLFFGRLYEVPTAVLSETVDRLIQELDMGSFANRPCGALSSGQKQRANIARAFLHRPELLILDEPTATLDVWSGQFIVEAIRRERAAQKAILFSTHIMSEVEYLCDRIYLVHGGEIVEHGTLAGILERSGCSNLTDAFLQLAKRSESKGRNDPA